MLVSAKCVTPAWDSNSATMYEPGMGPSPEGLYEIDREGPLAKLKLGRTYVFDFDRNSGPDDKPHDYTCEQCGETKDTFGRKFTLASLGTHTRSAHKREHLEPDPLPPPPSDRVCDQCGKVLKSAYGLRLHIEHSHPFQPIEVQSEPVDTTSEAETAVPA